MLQKSMQEACEIFHEVCHYRIDLAGTTLQMPFTAQVDCRQRHQGMSYVDRYFTQFKLEFPNRKKN